MIAEDSCATLDLTVSPVASDTSYRLEMDIIEAGGGFTGFRKTDNRCSDSDYTFRIQNQTSAQHSKVRVQLESSGGTIGTTSVGFLVHSDTPNLADFVMQPNITADTLNCPVRKYPFSFAPHRIDISVARTNDGTAHLAAGAVFIATQVTDTLTVTEGAMQGFFWTKPTLFCGVGVIWTESSDKSDITMDGQVSLLGASPGSRAISETTCNIYSRSSKHHTTHFCVRVSETISYSGEALGENIRLTGSYEINRTGTESINLTTRLD